MISETSRIYGKITTDEQQLLHLYRDIKDKKLKRTVIELLSALAK
ncbi:MAG: hypothetical protein QMD01_00270 [Thermodesulfovibrionales bacterium]|nr:hypothetical protein [Thermodesulfovibrionales bacterium]